MSYPFDPPPGDVGSLEAGARALGKLATDLSNQAKSATSAAGIALQEWQAPRADDFKNATQALVDELDMVVTATGNTANVIVNYATALQTAITNIATFKQKYDAAVVMSKGPGNTDPMGDAHEQSIWVQQAINAHTDLQTYARKIASAIDTETGLAVPHSSKLSPVEIARRVDSALAINALDRSEFFNGNVSDDAAWAMLHTVDGPVFDIGVPAPGDAGFQAWDLSLSPTQQLLETQKLNTSFNPKGFDPYKTVQGGQLPPWAVTFNDTHQRVCSVDGALPRLRLLRRRHHPGTGRQAMADRDALLQRRQVHVHGRLRPGARGRRHQPARRQGPRLAHGFHLRGRRPVRLDLHHHEGGHRLSYLQWAGPGGATGRFERREGGRERSPVRGQGHGRIPDRTTGQAMVGRRQRLDDAQADGEPASRLDPAESRVQPGGPGCEHPDRPGPSRRSPHRKNWTSTPSGSGMSTTR